MSTSSAYPTSELSTGLSLAMPMRSGPLPSGRSTETRRKKAGPVAVNEACLCWNAPSGPSAATTAESASLIWKVGSTSGASGLTRSRRAARSGKGAREDHVALVPAADAARGRLLVFLNGSGGSPTTAITTSTNNSKTVARAAGLHVLALGNLGDLAAGVLCRSDLADRDGCYEPTRLSGLLTGELQTGAALGVADIQWHEGVYARLEAALATLSTVDPGGGWSAFLDVSRSRPKRTNDLVRYELAELAGQVFFPLRQAYYCVLGWRPQ